MERLSSPLLGAFSISWCVWNWKFLVILFSNNSATTTFELVEKIAFPDLSSVLLRGLFLPLLTSLAYVFVYPYPARYVYRFTLNRQREINQIKQRIAEETPLTVEESRKLRAEYVENELRHTETIQRLNDEIARLNLLVETQDKKDRSVSPLSKAERIYDKLEPTQLALLRLLEKKGGQSLENELIELAARTRVKTEFDLGELERRKLLTRSYSRQGTVVKFTHEGRGVLLKSESDDGSETSD
jgi:predicted transcriptional regulator